LGRGKAEHHERIASGAHQIITLLDHLAVLAVVESELFPPIKMLHCWHVSWPRSSHLKHVVRRTRPRTVNQRRHCWHCWASSRSAFSARFIPRASCIKPPNCPIYVV